LNKSPITSEINHLRPFNRTRHGPSVGVSVMDRFKSKLVDFATFTTIAMVAFLFGFSDTARAAIIVDRIVFYIASISAAASLVVDRREKL
jgi:uncharacterized membrane protein YtjA (UPF0391 family)